MRNAFLATLALLFAGPATAEDLRLRDLNVVPAASAPASASVSTVSLDAWFDRDDATYQLGDAVRLFVRAGEDGFVTAFSIGPAGDVAQIYPNAFHPDNFVRPGATIEIPGPGARAMVTGPVGLERVEIVLTRGHEPVCPPSRLSGQGPLRTLVGGASALQRDLEVVAAGEPGGRLATIETSFRSTAALTVAPVTVVVAASRGSTEIVVPAQGYPLPQY